ncbi:MAG: T9SS type A sorting domain-containing protein [Armatimonadetes bacterium]|nr:T9SS type A sorting domain-containing protein [Armatimonadota bacterium]
MNAQTGEAKKEYSIYHDDRLPDSLLGVSTRSNGYLIDFKAEYGDQFNMIGLPKSAVSDSLWELNVLNPYIQPNSHLHAAYGSGDVNQDSIVGPDDYYDMVNNQPQNDFADIDGNGIPSDTSDVQLLYEFLTGQIDYLPGHGNQLFGQEVIDWNTNVSAIDSTDTHTYAQDWNCVEFSIQDYLNYNGYPGDDIPLDFYSIDYLGRFNNKEYLLMYMDIATSIGHMMNCFLLRDSSSTDLTNWWAKEPQTDGMAPLINVFNNLPVNYDIRLQGIMDFQNLSNPSYARCYTLIRWRKDSTGIAINYQKPGLITSIPQDIPIIEPTLLGVDNEKDNISTSYSLNQNYPNPFNPITNINFTLPNIGYVKLGVFDIRGRYIITLLDGMKEPGEYNIEFNGSKYSSGIYMYQLVYSGQVQIGKMILLK